MEISSYIFIYDSMPVPYYKYKVDTKFGEWYEINRSNSNEYEKFLRSLFYKLFPGATDKIKTKLELMKLDYKNISTIDEFSTIFSGIQQDAAVGAFYATNENLMKNVEKISSIKTLPNIQGYTYNVVNTLPFIDDFILDVSVEKILKLNKDYNIGLFVRPTSFYSLSRMLFIVFEEFLKKEKENINTLDKFVRLFCGAFESSKDRIFFQTMNGKNPILPLPDVLYYLMMDKVRNEYDFKNVFIVYRENGTVFPYYVVFNKNADVNTIKFVLWLMGSMTKYKSFDDLLKNEFPDYYKAIINRNSMILNIEKENKE